MNYELASVLLYAGEDGSVCIKLIVDNKSNTMRTTLQSMAELFKNDVKTIIKHLNNIFNSEELFKEEVIINPNKSTNCEILIINHNIQRLLYKANEYDTFKLNQDMTCKLEA